MTRKQFPSKEEIIAIAKKFQSRQDFKKAHPRLHNRVYQKGFKDEAFAHMKKQSRMHQQRHALEIDARFGRLTLKKDLGMVVNKKGTYKYRRALFKCDCGNPDLVDIIVANVKDGQTQSCGKCRYFEDPENYGEVETKCEICCKPIQTRKNRIKAGRGRFCSQECLFDWRTLEAEKRNIGFRHEDGTLTVESFFRHPSQKDSNGNSTIMAQCRCDCGELHSTHWVSIQFGRCLRCPTCQGAHHSNNQSRFEELKGKQFGRLTVVGYKYVPGNNGINSHYLCDCECGTKNHPVGSAHALVSGHTTSCGCWEGNGRDTYKGFKGNKEHREKDCELYFVEVAGGPIQKFGIAESTAKRGVKGYGNYTKHYKVITDLNRAKCWVIEQALLYETIENFPAKDDIDKSKIKQGYAGGTELRIGLNTEYYEKKIENLAEQARIYSWRSLYERFVTGHQRDLRKQQLRKAIASGLLEKHVNPSV